MSEEIRRGKGRPSSGIQKCTIAKCEGQFGSGLPKNKTGGRGLCKRCLEQATRLVKRNVTTWEELEKLGLALPKYHSDFERLLYAARANQKPE